MAKKILLYVAGSSEIAARIEASVQPAFQGCEIEPFSDSRDETDGFSKLLASVANGSDEIDAVVLVGSSEEQRQAVYKARRDLVDDGAAARPAVEQIDVERRAREKFEIFQLLITPEILSHGGRY